VKLKVLIFLLKMVAGKRDKRTAPWNVPLTDIGIVKSGPRVHTFKNGWISGSFERLSTMSLHSLHVAITKLVLVSWQTRTSEIGLCALDCQTTNLPGLLVDRPRSHLLYAAHELSPVSRQHGQVH
jgi:hypothetical protein